MARYSVPFTTWANSSVEIEVSDTITDPKQIAELAQQQMDEQAPSLCHQCASGGQGGLELEIGDDWEPNSLDGDPEIIRLDA